MQRIKGLLLVSCGILFGSGSLGQTPPAKSTKAYVGSETCATCHTAEHARWQTSLHAKMYQKPDKARAVLLGDFSVPDPLLTFKKEEVAYTIGSRWEQLYVTTKTGEETLLPAKWLIKPRKWAPLDPEHARKPLVSKNCHGCHTTSYDPKSNTYAEMNIGCEACHGPGSAHVRTANRSDILRGQNPEVCGRCHTRGKDAKEGLDYVVQFDPSQKKLSEAMIFSQPENKTTRNWWANAVERDRHQEYLGYLQSGHAKSLETLRRVAEKNPSQVTRACYTCHSSEYHSAGNRAAVMPSQLQYGVTCLACHDPHGEKRMEPAGQRANGGDAVCLACHFVRGVAGHAAQHPPYPCPKGAVRCIDCHMPVTGITAADFNIRSHTMKIIPPQEAERLGMPSSCNNSRCHSDRSLEWLQEQFPTRAAQRRR